MEGVIRCEACVVVVVLGDREEKAWGRHLGLLYHSFLCLSANMVPQMCSGRTPLPLLSASDSGVVDPSLCLDSSEACSPEAGMGLGRHRHWDGPGPMRGNTNFPDRAGPQASGGGVGWGGLNLTKESCRRKEPDRTESARNSGCPGTEGESH